MRELILHGGLGTRLLPLSAEVPKGFIPIRNLSNVEHIIEKSECIDGDKAITIPVGDGIIPYLIEAKKLPLRFRETNPAPMQSTVRYLEEGDESVLVHWGDTVTSIDIAEMIRFHEEIGADATMALWETTNLRELKHWGSVTLDEEGNTDGHPVPDISPRGLIKAGVFIFNPSMAKEMRRIAPEDWDMSTILNKLLFEKRFKGYVFHGYRINLNYGFDLIKAARMMGEYDGRLQVIDSSVRFCGRVEIGDNVSIGEGVEIKEGVHISNSIILCGAIIEKNATIVNSVIGPESIIEQGSFLNRKMVTKHALTELNESPY